MLDRRPGCLAIQRCDPLEASWYVSPNKLPSPQSKSHSLTRLNLGMHKHFRMIAISEHLRNHGFDPDQYQHTRIPYIWQKLRTYYNLDIIDERENFDEDEPEDRYAEFSLPKGDFYEAMMQRALRDPSDAPSSPPELDLEAGPSSPPKKRKRTETVSRTRGTSREDTEEATDAQSPAARSTRGSRGRTRAASAAKAEKAETTEEEAESEEEEEEEEDEDESGSGEDNDEAEEETTTQASKSTRGSTRTRGRGRTRAGRRRGR